MRKTSLASAFLFGIVGYAVAATVSPQARMTAAAFNKAVWTNEQKTAIAAATKAAPTRTPTKVPTKTPTPKPTATP